jgi:hypothetical protein
MNARSTICKSSLRQISSLITSYSTAYDGYLPNDDATYNYNPGNVNAIRTYNDLGRGVSNSNSMLYRFWQGHLLPFLDNAPNSYFRCAKVTKNGVTVWDNTGSSKTPSKPEYVYGWNVVNEAYLNGGYGDLKVFICPEIHANTFDVQVNMDYGVKIPRISQLATIYGWGIETATVYNMNAGDGGIPTTYCAQDKFFGAGPDNSYRMDQIKDPSQKVFLLEGSCLNSHSDGHGNNGSIDPPYFYTNTYSPFTGGALIANFSIASVFDRVTHKLNFVHDSIDEFWIMSGAEWFTYYFPSNWMSQENKNEFAEKFNLQFVGKASMVRGSNNYSEEGTIGFDIVSYVNPYLNGVSIGGGSIFDGFFAKNNPGVALKQFVAFTDAPNDYKYLVGNMSVLFGDGSVTTKDNAWLCNNRLKITDYRY